MLEMDGRNSRMLCRADILLENRRHWRHQRASIDGDFPAENEQPDICPAHS